MKLKKNSKFIVAADGAAASGKTTGSRIISRKYGLKFLSSGLLYRYAGHQLLKYKPKNKIKFLKLKFKNLNYNKINKINLHSQRISEYTSIIAKQKKIRNILKKFQQDFASKHKRVCIEGRDIGTVILPKADLKFFFICNYSFNFLFCLKSFFHFFPRTHSSSFFTTNDNFSRFEWLNSF